jgi:hypothetical protein
LSPIRIAAMPLWGDVARGVDPWQSEPESDPWQRDPPRRRLPPPSVDDRSSEGDDSSRLYRGVNGLYEHVLLLKRYSQGYVGKVKFVSTGTLAKIGLGLLSEFDADMVGAPHGADIDSNGSDDDSVISTASSRRSRASHKSWATSKISTSVKSAKSTKPVIKAKEEAARRCAAIRTDQ